MGLVEVLRHLPRLLRLRGSLQQRILQWRPDVFIGVDFKEFNLGLARRLKKAGHAHGPVRESPGLGLAPGAVRVPSARPWI
jgi:lipid A disaccharide synthetase